MPELSVLIDDVRTPFDLTEEKITIGRAPDNMLQIDDPSVSGRHAQLVLLGERYQLKDLGSTNGTRVNREVKRHVFAGRRPDMFGKVEARFESDATGEAQPFSVAGEIEARPAETSEKPANFDNASPFPKRQSENDPVAIATMAAAAVAILAFLISMAGLLQIHEPR